MKKLLRYGFLTLIVLFLVIQLVPVDRSNPPVVSDFDGPIEVKQILQRSCYDCHSNESEWPWYSYVAPVSWLVAYDVEEGRDELNFSDWQRFAGDAHLLEEIPEEVEEGEMPMPIYLLTHREAKVSPQELAVLRGYFGGEGGHDD
jgi:hypothetical protein